MNRLARRIRGLFMGGLGLFLLTGCWDQRAIDQRAIVLAIGVSADLHWTLLFPNVTVTASSISSLGQSNEFYAITAKAKSYQKALHRVQLQANREVSMGDVQLVDLSASLSRSQLAGIMDSMILTGAIPAQVWLAASQTSPSTLLIHPSPQTVVPVYYLSSYFDCHACHAADFGVRAWQWWDRAVTPGVSPVLPVFTETPEGAAIYQILVYPVQGKPLLMPRQATQGYAYLMGKVKSGTQKVNCGGTTYMISPIIDDANSRVRLTPTAVDVRIVIHARGEMADMPAGLLITRATERAVEQATAARLVQLSRFAIHWANQTHTDPFGYAKRAAWLDNQTAAAISPQALATLPIQAVIRAQVKLQGEGLAR